NGYDAAKDQYVDMVKAGIIDPALVARTALLNGASVAGLMLTTNVLVTELKEDAEPVQGAAAWPTTWPPSVAIGSTRKPTDPLRGLLSRNGRYLKKHGHQARLL